jgi:serine/threonine protein phosphatase PrpC
MPNLAESDTQELKIPVFSIPLHVPEPFSSLVKVEFGAKSDTGKVRPNNEDAYIICRIGRYWQNLMTNLREDLPDQFAETGYAMAVADGMGGHAGGEVASRLAIRICVNLTLIAARWALKLDNPATRDRELNETMKRAEDYFHKVDIALKEHSEAYPRLKGMGTTLTGIYSFGDDLIIVHVGDTRAYLFRKGRLVRLTHDDTLAQYLVDIGQITPEQAKTHRLKHSLTSCLGGESGRINLQIAHHKLLNDDQLMLCSDGLTEMVADERIGEILRDAKSCNEACEKLIDLALQNGGTDNITVALAHYTIPPRPETHEAP